MNRFLVISCLVILTFLAGLSLAGIPKMINYQGMLTDNSGNPLNATVSITFKIYNDSLSGILKWQESQGSVTVTNGLFNVILGSVTPIDLDFSEDYWLDIMVGGEQMPSRLKFTSVGYAYRAKMADSAMVAVSAPTGGGWTDDGTVVRLTTGMDSVGIGTTIPKGKLHVSSGFIITDPGWGIQLLQGNGEYSSQIFTSGNDLNIMNFGTGCIRLWTGTIPYSATVRLHITNDGNVGIGTTNPSSLLHAHGSAPADANNGQLTISESTSGSGRSLLLGRTTSYGFIQSHNQQPLALNPLGNKVGIGTTSPASRLEVKSSGFADGIRLTSSDGDNLFVAGEAFDGSCILQVYDASGAGKVWIDGGGESYFTYALGIGMANPTQMLDVNGTARLRSMSTGTGTVVVADANGVLKKQSSGKRYKENIRGLEADQEKVLQLEPVRFDWKTTGEPDIGLIAEEVEKAIPDLVVYDNEGKPDAVKYDKISLYLLGLVKELKTENEELRRRIEALETNGERDLR